MSVAILSKAFSLLEALPTEPPGTALADIAARTGLPKPTAHRLLRSLIELGYAVQDPASGGYRSAGRLVAGGGRNEDRLRLRVLPIMRRLHRRFDENVNLGVLDGGTVRYLAVLETTRPLRRIVETDVSDPVHSTALGRAILAGLPVSARAEVIARCPLVARTPRTITATKDLDREIAASAQRGYAVEEEENDVGVICLAVAIPGSEPPAAISLSLPTARCERERRAEIIAALRESIA
ncbi:MAG: IclR family transcriptional regulator [Planctomycetes bacterium]|nr:IclR family transcriptional regulator [Planctomycetota bacterium]